MMSVEKIKPQKKQLENGCRQIHISLKSRRGAIFCKNCDDYVEKHVFEKNCTCCGKRTLDLKSTLPVVRIINFGIKQHKSFLRDFTMFPSDVGITKDGTKFTKPTNPIYLEVRFQGQVHEVRAKYLALAMERPNHPDILQIFKKNVKLKGLRIIIPEDEPIDSKCEQCNEQLRLDRRGREFCARCDKTKDIWDLDYFKT